jgi:nitroreductase
VTPADGDLTELRRIVRSRRMVRAFTAEPVDDHLVDELLDTARRAPSAGNTQPWELLVLTGGGVQRYWQTTLGERRVSFSWQGLLRAPVLVIPYVRPDAYAERYAEPDKVSTGLGSGPGAWPVPYWWVDGGALVQNLLLAVTSAGLGACFFGQFEHEDPVRRAFSVPPDRRALGTVALGHAAPDAPGASTHRPRRPLGSVVHRGGW